MERVVANVAMRHDTHRTAARAKHAARCPPAKAPSRAWLRDTINRAPLPTLIKEPVMAKEDLVEFGGHVSEVLPDNRFRVVLKNGFQVWAYSSGRMKKNRIRFWPATA